MEYGKLIAYMTPGDEIDGFYLLKQASVKTPSNGSLFLSAILSDATGTIEAKHWNYSGGISSADEGRIVKVRGDVTEFRGAPQLKIKTIQFPTPEDHFDISDIIPTAPIDSVKELEHIHSLIESMEDSDYRSICECMLDRHINSFGRIPAAKSVHHSFLSGLLMHTSNMLRIADFLASDIYPETVNRDLLLAGTLLHDFAKEKEYILNEYGTVTDFSTEGILLGHLVMGSEEIAQTGLDLGIPSEKIALLQHMVLSHHGQPEYGAAVIPIISEAELLSYIDLLDSRMEIYAEAYKKMEPGQTSEKIFALDKKIYKHL